MADESNKAPRITWNPADGVTYLRLADVPAGAEVLCVFECGVAMVRGDHRRQGGQCVIDMGVEYPEDDDAE